jgi:hypothetical protein
MPCAMWPDPSPRAAQARLLHASLATRADLSSVAGFFLYGPPSDRSKAVSTGNAQQQPHHTSPLFLLRPYGALGRGRWPICYPYLVPNGTVEVVHFGHLRHVIKEAPARPVRDEISVAQGHPGVFIVL